MGASLGVELFVGVTSPQSSGPAPSPEPSGSALARLVGFRAEFYSCLSARADALFELTDAILCQPGPVHTLVGLSLEPEHRRGHGGLYDALGAGGVDVARLSWTLTSLPIPRVGGKITLAVDVSAWLRPLAATSPDRCFCHVYGRGRGGDQQVPGWPYQVIVALGSGRTSWTAPLDARRLDPGADATAVTAAQLRAVYTRLRQAGHHHDGEADVVVVVDAGYDSARLAYLLGDLPLLLVGRLRSDRVMMTLAPSRGPGVVGRPRRHGAKMVLAEPDTWPAPATDASAPSAAYGTVRATSWDRMHPRLTHRGPWTDHAGPPPIIEGTLIRVAVDRLPGRTKAASMWLWTSAPVSDVEAVMSAWTCYLRRFDEEHTFRFFKQTLGWTRPRLRDPAAADRWTWLVLVAYTQLRLARTLAADLRRPWERPLADGHVLTPARVRRGFRNLRAKVPSLAGAPKLTHPGPGRPPGSKNRHRAAVQPVGKQINIPEPAATQG